MVREIFSFQVLPTSGVPIYRQIMDQVRNQVAAGRLKPGDLLPSVRTVAEHLEVNHMTVSKAYSLLEREGVLELMRGKGMRIRQAAAEEESMEQRISEIEPLLKNVAVAAWQLNLPPEQVLEKLSTILKRNQEKENG